MKLRPDPQFGLASRARCARRRRQASALIIVLILLSLMAAMMVSNAVTLRRLKVEVQRIEQKQKQRLAHFTDGTQSKPVSNHKTAP